MRGQVLVLLLLVAGSASAQTEPVLSRQASRLHLRSMPPLVAHPEVSEYLASGLTTSFVVEVTARDGQGVKAVGGGWIEIRYELWDELYLVRWVDVRNQSQRVSLPTLAKLLDWWRELDLVVAEAAGLGSSEPWQVRVRLSVLPFSSDEQRDAQRWFTRSLETKGGEGGSSDLQLAEVLNVVIATSIGRESSLAFDWRLSVPVGAGQ